jgi:hypothetical protein
MAFINKENLDNNNINNIKKRYIDWVIIVDEENAIVDKSQSRSSDDDIENNKEINRRSHSPVEHFNTNNFEESYCDFVKKINLDKVLECLLVPISSIINFLQKNMEVNENNNDLKWV